jgi:hypothetical protein
MWYLGNDTKWSKAGHLQIDMGKYVNKENSVIKLPFQAQTITNDAEIHLSATIVVNDPKNKISV